MNKLLCFSEKDFIKIMKMNGWITYKDLPKDIAIISIKGTRDYMDYYSIEDTNHYFDIDTDQILNLNFDDVNEDIVFDNYYVFKSISNDQVVKSIEFIKNNIGKDFYIHCEAGKSRSQAFVRLILDYFPEYYDSTSINFSNPCLTPNINIFIKLKNELLKNF